VEFDHHPGRSRKEAARYFIDVAPTLLGEEGKLRTSAFWQQPFRPSLSLYAALWLQLDPTCISQRHSDTHERGGYQRADVLTFVLRVGKFDKLVVKLLRFPVLLSRFDGVHRRAIE
jgi:hypothetical protein